MDNVFLQLQLFDDRKTDTLVCNVNDTLHVSDDNVHIITTKLDIHPFMGEYVFRSFSLWICVTVFVCDLICLWRTYQILCHCTPKRNVNVHTLNLKKKKYYDAIHLPSNIKRKIPPHSNCNIWLLADYECIFLFCCILWLGNSYQDRDKSNDISSNLYHLDIFFFISLQIKIISMLDLIVCIVFFTLLFFLQFCFLLNSWILCFFVLPSNWQEMFIWLAHEVRISIQSINTILFEVLRKLKALPSIF